MKSYNQLNGKLFPQKFGKWDMNNAFVLAGIHE